MNWLIDLFASPKPKPKSPSGESMSQTRLEHRANLVLANAEIAAAKAYIRVLSEADPEVLKLIRDQMTASVDKDTQRNGNE